MAVRMKDIAAIVGVSQTTVSHVLLGRDAEFRIRSDTARKVREAAARMGYAPSALARNFKQHRSHSIGLAVGDVANPFWAHLVLGAQQEAERQGYTLVVSHTGESVEKERKLATLLRERRIDGAILSPSHLQPRHLAALRKERLPFVLVDRAVRGLDVPSVITDSIAGVRLAVDHLVGRGHRRIAYLGGPTHISTFRDRLRGYRRAMARHALKPGPIGVTPSDPEEARKAALRLFQNGAQASALVAANYWLTIGALRGVPEDVVVVGFDDLYLADLFRRPVTTVAQPVEELGRQAVRLLLQEIAKPGSAHRHLILPPRLVVRRARP